MLCRLAQDVFELGKELFDRVQVWRLWRQEQQMCTRVADCSADSLSLVAAEIVQHDDVSGGEPGDQRLLYPSGETLAVDRAVGQARRIEAVGTQRGEEGQRSPVAVRMVARQAVSAQCLAAQRRRVGLDPGFVKKD